jgi:hypothetical protein
VLTFLVLILPFGFGLWLAGLYEARGLKSDRKEKLASIRREIARREASLTPHTQTL